MTASKAADKIVERTWPTSPRLDVFIARHTLSLGNIREYIFGRERVSDSMESLVVYVAEKGSSAERGDDARLGVQQHCRSQATCVVMPVESFLLRNRLAKKNARKVR